VRLFLAVDPDVHAREALGRQLTRLRRQLADWEACIRWTSADAAHLTVRFLGETPDDHLPVLVDALGSALDLPSFDAALDRAGAFASRGRVRTLWLSIGTGLEALHAVHDAVGGRLRAAGWPDDARSFSPHVTVGRVRDRCRRPTRGLAEALSAVRIDPIGWTIDRVILYSSDLTGPRPVYTARHRVLLAGRPSA